MTANLLFCNFSLSWPLKKYEMNLSYAQNEIYAHFKGDFEISDEQSVSLLTW